MANTRLYLANKLLMSVPCSTGFKVEYTPANPKEKSANVITIYARLEYKITSNTLVRTSSVNIVVNATVKMPIYLFNFLFLISGRVLSNNQVDRVKVSLILWGIINRNNHNFM